MTNERYYLQYHPFDDSWELWERTSEGVHALRASFSDVDTQRFPMVEIFSSLLNATIAGRGEAKEGMKDRERVYEPLTPEEIGKGVSA